MTDNIRAHNRICFIACDSGPAAHFGAIATYLFLHHDVFVNIHATGSAFQKLSSMHLPDGIHLSPFSIEHLTLTEEEKVAERLVRECMMNGARNVILDIANRFGSTFQRVLANDNEASKIIKAWSYYDNPENYVPGGFSINAASTISMSHYIMFANLRLADPGAVIYSSPGEKIDLKNKMIHGIGYYPVEDIELLRQRRMIEKSILRSQYVSHTVHHIFIYFGGNNDAYFEKSFPSFLSNVAQVDKDITRDVLFILHQHPAAKKLNKDVHLLQDWQSKNRAVQIIISNFSSSNEALVVADAVIYYQTSMAPQFALLGLPILQTGHDVYHDILVKNKLCYTAVDSIELCLALSTMKNGLANTSDTQQDRNLIYDAIGYSNHWPENLIGLLV